MTLSQLLKTTRQYFWSHDFTEVEPQYLNSSLPLEPNLYTFKTTWQHRALDFYLPTSPEVTIKQSLATNPTDSFIIGHSFRDLESDGPHHRPEFIMLEYYLINKNLDDLIQFTKNFLSQFCSLEFEVFNLPNNLPNNESDFNQFFLNEIEPKLPSNKIVFITGYPSFLSPLASSHNGIASRFEIYINGIEIANGCEENCIQSTIINSFQTENNYRQQNQLPTHPISTEFASSCAHIPPSSGVGIGLDRLLMVINHQTSL